MPKPSCIILDSWAVMAFLEDESCAERVVEVISDAREDGTPLLMTTVNAGEIWYVMKRRKNAVEADHVIDLLHEIGVRLVDADWPLTRIAAGFKAKGSISYADCYAAALCKQRKGQLLTGDPEFGQFKKDIRIIWLT